MSKLLQLGRLGGLLSVLLACAPSAWATFPAFASACTVSANGGTNSTTDTVNLPASIASGDLVLIFHNKDGGGTSTVPGSWVEIKDALSPGSTSHVTIAYLIASGGETSVVVTTTVAERFTALACRITGWHGTTPPEVSTGATNTNNAPDPDSVTASWGSDDNLFIAVYSNDINATNNGYPSNYPDNRQNSGTTASAGLGAIASLNSASASSNPNAFALTGSDQWWAGTVVVRPAAGGAAPSPKRTLMGVGT